MRNQRKRRIADSSDDSDSSDDGIGSEQEEVGLTPNASTATGAPPAARQVLLAEVARKTKAGPRNRVCKQARFNIAGGSKQASVDVGNESEFARKAPFCCAHCTCSDMMIERVNRFHGGIRDDTVCYWVEPDQTGTMLHHRRCCHGLVRTGDETEEEFASKQLKWSPPYQSELEHAEDRLLSGVDLSEPIRQDEWIDRAILNKAQATAKRAESGYHNESGGTIHEFDRLNGTDCKTYRTRVVVPFQQHREAAVEPRRGLVVLDCFAGVGTGILTLKKLGLGISKIIYLEHDQVAKHVYRTQHDVEYFNADAREEDKRVPDNIEHVYEYEQWESLVGHHQGNEDVFAAKVETFLKKHGPVDLVLGGPPCIDYSKVNAHREGTEGKQGKYLIEMGKFVRTLERLQHPPVYFLAENVFLTGSELHEVNAAFGIDWDPINLDAKDFSPCRRNRHFWTNIPLDNFDYAEGAPIGPASCLAEGYRAVGNVEDPFFRTDGRHKRQTVTKCNCFMASKARIDELNSLRMYVFRDQNQDGTHWFGRPITAVERELMMGYPKGYIQGPVEELFQTLQDKALCHQYDEYNNDTGKKVGMFEGYWKDILPKKYHHFCGNYHQLPCTDPHRFGPTNKEPTYIELKLSPPVNIVGEEGDYIYTTDVSFFNAENYSKHLTGLAYSVPVVEHLLQPLQKIFKRQSYPQFSYDYPWKAKR